MHSSTITDAGVYRGKFEGHRIFILMPNVTFLKYQNIPYHIPERPESIQTYGRRL
jgi:hypothetical protein